MHIKKKDEVNSRVCVPTVSSDFCAAVAVDPDKSCIFSYLKQFLLFFFFAYRD
jgi:hypothetical protein